MKGNTYLNVLELRRGCNMEELHHAVMDIFTDADADEGKQIELLYRIADSALKKKEFIGTSTDFHNVGVECARRNAEDLACDYLERGLNKYPTSVDLLADYIKYGTACDRLDKCREYYNVLTEISKDNWNWRAFSFSIDYLMTELERGNSGNEIKQSALTLSSEFRQYLPHDENGYLAQAEIHNKFNERELEIAILEEAISKIAKAPKALLRLADIYYSDGRLEETLNLLHRCERDSLEPQMGVSQGYLYYLDGLCQSNILMKELDKEDHMDCEKVRNKVMEIYDNMKIAKKTLKDEHYGLLKEWRFLIILLESKTKIEYPYY